MVIHDHNYTYPVLSKDGLIMFGNTRDACEAFSAAIRATAAKIKGMKNPRQIELYCKLMAMIETRCGRRYWWMFDPSTGFMNEVPASECDDDAFYDE